MSRVPTHVFSTSTTDVQFAQYHPYTQGQIPQIKRKLVIKGGANVPNKHLVTPRGVPTRISEEAYSFLMADPLFIKMMTDGFYSFGYAESDVDRAVRDMQPKDGSAPKTEADYTRVENNTGGLGIKVGRSAELITTPE